MRLIDTDKLEDKEVFRYEGFGIPTGFIKEAETINAIPIDFIENAIDEHERRRASYEKISNQEMAAWEFTCTVALAKLIGDWKEREERK